MLKSEAIKEFLQAAETKNEKYAGKYNINLECQVNVFQGEGRPTKGTTKLGFAWRGFTDGNQTWKHFRIPYGAKDNPRYTDGNLNWSLGLHAKAIGLTGWNWRERISEWVAFDFDSIVDHNKGLTNEELHNIRQRLEALPYCSIYSSSSGVGYHLYIDLINCTEIGNHTEHAALSRAILSRISGICGFPLADKVDVCGSNIWVWKRGAKGYKALKTSESPFDCQSVQEWREHLPVFKRKPRQTKIKKIGEINNSVQKIPLDLGHQSLLKFLDGHRMGWWWDSDHWMLVCHTSALKEAHKTLQFKGIFDTISKGTEDGDQNCFCFPLPDSAWVVRRHTPLTAEAKNWNQDRAGWSYCYLNRVPDIHICLGMAGVEFRPDQYAYKSLKDAARSLNLAGVQINVKPEWHGREAEIAIKAGNKLLVRIRKYGDETLDDWKAGKEWWERIFQYSQPASTSFPADHLVRHCIATTSSAGWFVSTGSNWVAQKRPEIIDVLLSKGIKQGTVKEIMGQSVLIPWKLENHPFAPEYPGNRIWNRDGAKLAVEPKPGDFSHWEMILTHVSQSLNEPIKEDDWCQRNLIQNGKEYLAFWVASLIQCPLEPLPYLFLYGPQNSGKSILHEALSLLFASQRGICRADLALTSDFNGELAGAVLCVVEETNLRQAKKALEKMKDWVTSRTLPVRAMYNPMYEIANSTHWIQCANDPGYCPIFPGDTRVVVLQVPLPANPIPKGVLLESLRNESGAFLDHILNLEIPDSNERLRIPCLETTEKNLQEELHETYLETFIKTQLKAATGWRILWSDFIDEFLSFLPANERNYWTPRRISIYFPSTIQRGKMGEYNETYIGNYKFAGTDSQRAEQHSDRRLVRVKGRLRCP